MAIGLLAAPSPAPARDAAWPLYRNEKFGFSLRYPPAFVVGAYRDQLPADLKAPAASLCGDGWMRVGHHARPCDPLRTSLLPGNYTVEFGLGTARYPICLAQPDPDYLRWWPMQDGEPMKVLVLAQRKLAVTILDLSIMGELFPLAPIGCAICQCDAAQ